MKYDGELNRRIPGKQFGLLAGEPEFKSEAVRVVNARFAKFPALFEAHNVPLGDWQRLAYELAVAHVPGFKVSKPVGRSTKWGELDKAELRIDVDATIAATRHKTVGEALRHLQKTDEKWKPMLRGLKQQAMRDYYYGADQRWVSMVTDSRSLHELQSTETEIKKL